MFNRRVLLVLSLIVVLGLIFVSTSIVAATAKSVKKTDTNSIDIKKLALVAKHFGKTQNDAGFTSAADVNSDG